MDGGTREPSGSLAGSLRQPTTWLSVGTVLAPSASLFAGGAAAPIFIVSALMTIWAAWPGKPWRAIPKAPAVLLGAACVWAVLSCSWSITPADRALRAVLSLGGLGLLGLLVIGAAAQFTAADRARVETGLIVGAGTAVALLLMEVGSGYAVTRFASLALNGHEAGGRDSVVSRGVVITLLMAWPTLIALHRRYGPRGAALLFPLLVIGVVGNGKHAIILALAAGCLVFAFALLASPRMLRGLQAIIVAAVLAMPLIGAVLPPVPELGQSGLFNSARHRVVIWDYTVDEILKHPWRGWGMDASRSMPGDEQETVITGTGKDGGTLVSHYPHMPLHPHNGPLQVWLELGAAGAVLLAALVWTATGRQGGVARPAPERAAAMAAMVCAVVIGSISFGLWQGWWLASLWLTACQLAATRSALPPPGIRPCAASPA